MEEAIAFLAIGTFWFWALLVIEAIALFALVFNEKGTWATVTLVLTLVLLNFVSKIPIVHYVFANPVKTGLLVVGYFVAGTLWSIAKWWFFVRRRRENYDELKAEFLEEHKIQGDEVPPNLRQQWRHHIEYRYSTQPYNSKNCRDNCDCGIKPLVRNHKGDVLRWMSYWPVSATCTLIDDPVRKLFNWIFCVIHTHLQKVSDSAFKSTEADLRIEADNEGAAKEERS